MCALFFVVSILPQFLPSQTLPAQSKTLTLDQALNIAFDRNVTVAQSANSIENAKASVFQAYGSYIPRVNMGASFSRTGLSTPASIRTIGGIPFNVPRTETYYNTYNANVGLSYTLFDGFNREASFNSAQMGEIQAEQTYERTRQSIAYTVQSVYLNVLRNEQQVKVFQENLNNERKRLERIMEQNRVGAVAMGDVYRQQSQVALSEYNLINAQNTYDKSKADLFNLLALDVNSDFVVADSAINTQVKEVESAPAVQSLGSFNELYQQALSARPDYASTRASAEIADNTVTQAWSSYYPTVSINGGYSTNAQQWEVATDWENHSTNVGLTVSWTLPDFFGATQRIQSANIAKRNADLQLEQKARDIGVELKKALLDYDAARKLYEASQKRQIAAQQDKVTAEARYNLGSGTLLDLQVANAAFLSAQLETLTNAYGYLTSKKNLELVIGAKKY
jgi:outer membrane protein